MSSGKQPHILNASSNLIGIAFILITGLRITGKSEQTLADEISLAAAYVLLGSCLLSYVSMRSEKHARIEIFADYLFILGLCMLFIAVTAFSLLLF